MCDVTGSIITEFHMSDMLQLVVEISKAQCATLRVVSSLSVHMSDMLQLVVEIGKAQCATYG